MHTLLTPGDNPGGHAALSAHYAVVLPASSVIRRQISICTAVAVLLSQIWDIRFNDFTANVVAVTQPTPYCSGDHQFPASPTPKYRTYHMIPANQPRSCDAPQPFKGRKTGELSLPISH